MGVGGQRHVLVALRLGMTRYPLDTGLEGEENLASPGLDPRTVQPVTSRYTD